MLVLNTNSAAEPGRVNPVDRLCNCTGKPPSGQG